MDFKAKLMKSPWGAFSSTGAGVAGRKLTNLKNLLEIKIQLI